MVLQQAVDEAVAAADLAQEETLSSLVEEGHILPGGDALIPEPQTEQQMLETGPSPLSEPGGQPAAQPTEQPEDQPGGQPAGPLAAQPGE